MTPLRKKRLLLVAYGGGDAKRFYSQYLRLQAEGLVEWMLGHAWITDEGIRVLEELSGEEI